MNHSSQGLFTEPRVTVWDVALKSDYETQECSIARTLEIVGERWTLLVLRDCFFGVRRFSDLQRHIGLPKAVLAARLDTLVQAGILERSEYQTGRSEYLLTDRGTTLWPLLHSMSTWGDANLAPHGPRSIFRHVDCGTPLAAGAVCPTCGRAPHVGDVEFVPGPGRKFGHQREDDPVEQDLLAGHRMLRPLPESRS
jgi:DNA-binding HxlR family transcriptional regulator